MTDLINDMTERFLRDAGIAPGMRVLDVGCGRGDVSLMVARIVGEEGYVLGIDRDPAPVALARQRAAALDLRRVAFEERDLGAPLPTAERFDAAVGRRVLMYQPDPVAAIRAVAGAVRAGGLILFQENDATMGQGSLAPLELHRRVHQWIWRTVEREGANIHMGFQMPTVFEEAGLTVQLVRAEAVVQTPKIHHHLALIVRAMLPRILRQGVASEEEIDVDTLEARLVAERTQAGTTFVGDLVFSVCGRTPARA
ncbi:methyltransferase domain-containing protein [Sorangium sp. So ce1000]|uniref:methyltransferase domain-containing protein n=1 Tax=Sorangium sp. So ce1000 TaxID=3133325 RepID=UPI003F5EF84B